MRSIPRVPAASRRWRRKGNVDVAQLHLSLSDEQMAALQAIATNRQVPISQLLEEYVSYLLVGGQPVEVSVTDPTWEELAQIAERGGSFDWLADEPEIYSVA